jgi:hypothetical protein
MDNPLAYARADRNAVSAAAARLAQIENCIRGRYQGADKRVAARPFLAQTNGASDFSAASLEFRLPVVYAAASASAAAM